ncbi:oligosaccharide flippase family protein [Enterococcus larvae]|uniref:oligosaccharide flippase family protein n=1 Tax=Enterococcus larvae TaxID=2794352 RepID=UPI003F380F41
MKEKRMASNIIYNFIYTSLNLIFPIITAPYVSRVLGAEYLGRVNFATVVVNWFILFATFGTTTYGIREISRNKDDKEKINSTFSELVFINGLFSVITLVIYLFAVFNVSRFQEDPRIFLIFGLSILFNILNIDWFFQGIEEYKYITFRNAVVKVVSLISIFLFIHQKNDYYLYGAISVFVTGANSIFNYVHSRKLVKLSFSKEFRPFRHIKALSIFFVQTFLVNIYTNFDQLLVGFLISDTSVAFLNRAKILINMCVSISTSISNATLPRISYYRKKNQGKYNGLIKEILNYIYFFTLPTTIGLMCLSENIMFLMGGSTFLDASSLLFVMAPVVLLSPVSTFLQYQVLISSDKEKIGLIITFITSAISLCLNIILIPIIGIIAAAVVQVISELSAVLLRLAYTRKNLKDVEFSLYTTSLFKYFLASIVMSIPILVIKKYVVSSLVLSFVITVPIAVVIYILVLILTKDKICLSVLNAIKNRF